MVLTGRKSVAEPAGAAHRSGTFTAMFTGRGRRGRARALRRLLRDPAFPRPFSMDAFCELIAERRGRPVHLHPFSPSDTGTPSGMWWATATADHLFYDAGTSRYQQHLIIFHEIGHMLLDHDCPSLEDNRAVTWRPDPDDPESLRGGMSRIRYTSREEREAEWAATRIRRMIGTASAPSPHSGVLGRLESAVGFHREHEDR